jgi:conjugal transfer pilus assembly protein TrbC
MLLFASSCPAQVTDADIERAKGLQPSITDKDLDRAKQRYRTPTDAELDAAAVQSAPNVDALPRPSNPGAIDIEALAKRFEANRDRMAGAHGLISGPSLLVFVSLAMPDPTLTRLVEQAARANAILVLRGFENGSLKQTVSHLQRLIGGRQVAAQIDPQAFDRFAITKAPTFVLVRGGLQAQPCGDSMCLPAGAYASVAGDVSLDYALEYVERSSPRFSKEARGFIDRLRNNGS